MFRRAAIFLSLLLMPYIATAQVKAFGNLLVHELFHAMLADYRDKHGFDQPEAIEIAHCIADGELVSARMDELRECIEKGPDFFLLTHSTL